MLLRVGVENHRSFRDATELSFVATAQRDEPAHLLPTSVEGVQVVPVVGVYGANASGKSNLLHAIDLLTHFVGTSFARQPGRPLPHHPWAGAPAAPTRLDLDLLIDGVRHHYGFAFTASAITEEWLYRWPGRSKQTLLERDVSAERPWKLGRALGSHSQMVQEATRPDALFLSTAAHLNHEVLGPVAQAIAGSVVRAPLKDSDGLVLLADSPLLAPAVRPTLQRLLAAADLGILELRTQKPPEVATALMGGLFDVFAGLIPGDEAKQDAVRVRTALNTMLEVRFVHGAPGGPTWELPASEESRGTLSLLRRLEHVFQALQTGALLLADELDTSLHPDLCGAVVDLFTDPLSNPRGAQLLFSTHDRSLLRHLRRDEVLLVDKEADGASRLHFASDHAGLRGRDDLARAHERGVLGGSPILGDLRAAVAGLHNAS